MVGTAEVVVPGRASAGENDPKADAEKRGNDHRAPGHERGSEGRSGVGTVEKRHQDQGPVGGGERIVRSKSNVCAGNTIGVSEGARPSAALRSTGCARRRFATSSAWALQRTSATGPASPPGRTVPQEAPGEAPDRTAAPMRPRDHLLCRGGDDRAGSTREETVQIVG